MLNVGDTIQIDGRKAIVCYTATYNDENYICAALFYPTPFSAPCKSLKLVVLLGLADRHRGYVHDSSLLS